MNLPLPSGDQVKDTAFRLATTVHRELYRRTGGRLGANFGNLRILLLTTTGRRSGKPRTVPLNCLEDGDRFVLIASFGGDDRDPQWLKNLRANPTATVEIGGRTHQVEGRVATAEEKARYWPKMVEQYAGYDRYQAKTSRDIPVVILSRA